MTTSFVFGSSLSNITVYSVGTSLAVWWLRFMLPPQGVWVGSHMPRCTPAPPNRIHCIGNSPVVQQWLGLLLLPGTWVQFLVGKLRLCKPLSAAKNKIKLKRRTHSINIHFLINKEEHEKKSSSCGTLGGIRNGLENSASV